MREGRWVSGPWDDEPDEALWRDEATGFACAAFRVGWSGHWCGYVALPPEHPAHGLPDEYDYNVYVHGGATYAGDLAHSASLRLAMLTTACGNSNPWWVGFDCAHSGDSSPLDITDGHRFGTYRTLAYVKQQCAKLASELRDFRPAPPPPSEEEALTYDI